MVLESVISSPVIKSAMDVLKLRITSAIKTTSINSLKAIIFLSLNVYGSKAISNGVVKHTHRARPIITKSQYFLKLELKGIILFK